MEYVKSKPTKKSPKSVMAKKPPFKSINIENLILDTSDRINSRMNLMYDT